MKVTIPGEPNVQYDRQINNAFKSDYIVVVGFDPNATVISIEIIK